MVTLWPPSPGNSLRSGNSSNGWWRSAFTPGSSSSGSRKNTSGSVVVSENSSACSRDGRQGHGPAHGVEDDGRAGRVEAVVHPGHHVEATRSRRPAVELAGLAGRYEAVVAPVHHGQGH